jgi:hypothetical protein
MSDQAADAQTRVINVAVGSTPAVQSRSPERRVSALIGRFEARSQWQLPTPLRNFEISRLTQGCTSVRVAHRFGPDLGPPDYFALPQLRFQAALADLAKNEEQLAGFSGAGA